MKRTATIILFLATAALASCSSRTTAASGEESHEGTHDHASHHVVYTCPMHPEVQKHEPGNCPVCGMALVKREVEPAPVAEPPASHHETKP